MRAPYHRLSIGLVIAILNIWVTTLQGNTLGYTQFPSWPIPFKGWGWPAKPELTAPLSTIAISAVGLER